MMRLEASRLAYVKACMDRWARATWGAGSGSSMSITGKLMDGMGGTLCPLWLEDVTLKRAHDSSCSICKGRGRISAELDASRRSVTTDCIACFDAGKQASTGEIDGRSCIRCRGAGKYTATVLKVNPAGIKGTRYVGGKGHGDYIASLIEQEVRRWRLSDQLVWLHRIAVREYFHNGTHELKAHRLGVSLSFYRRTIGDVHGRVDVVLQSD